MTLRDIRRAKELTQERLAEMSGVDQSTISNLENGNIENPTWETVGRLATALDVEPAEVFPLPATQQGGA